MRSKGLVIKTYVAVISILFLGVYLFNHVLIFEGEDVVLKDNADLYKDVGVKELYVTVLDHDKNDGYIWSELNELEGKDDDGKDIKLKVILEERVDGLKCQECFGSTVTKSNAIIEQRGQSSRLDDQKSYKITLDKDEYWQGFNVLNLNKHAGDKTRIRNKFSFDIMASIPDLLGLRTVFVRLYVRDLSEGNISSFVDYGIFTHVEQYDEDYFKARYLEEEGSLYKVEFFEFKRYEDALQLKNNYLYDEEDFSSILDIKGNDDHSDLLEMLDSVNNQLVSINQTVNTYFNRENYLTWLAINMVLDNLDVSSKNYYLYSPKGTKQFYFLPWDYDGTMGRVADENRRYWAKGIHLYMNNVLHYRFFMDPLNVEALSQKVEEIRNSYVTDDAIELLTSRYYEEIFDALNTGVDQKRLMDRYDLMDSSMLPILYKHYLSTFLDIIDKNIETYYESLERPTPFFIGDEAYPIGELYRLFWSESVSLFDRQVTYDLVIAKDVNLSDIVYEEKGITNENSVVIPLEPGTYYVSMISYDEEGNIQHAFNEILEEALILHIQEIVVEE